MESVVIHNRSAESVSLSWTKLAGFVGEKLLVYEKNGHHCLEKRIFSREQTLFITSCLSCTKTAKLLLAFVEHRPFFNQSHPYFWPSAAEWLPLFFPPLRPVQLIVFTVWRQPCLSLLLSTGNTIFSTTLATGLCVCVCVCARFVQTGLFSVS